MPTTQQLVHSEALGKIASVPLVSGAIAYASTAISYFPIIERAYNFGDSVLAKALESIQPVTNAFAPQLKYIDSVAAGIIGYVENKFPYPFHVMPDDIAQYVEAKKDYGVGVFEGYKSTVEKTYDDRVVVPTKELFKHVGEKYDQIQSENVYLQKASATIASIYEQLNLTLQELNKKAHGEVSDNEKKVQTIAGRFFTELDNLHKFALSLPTESQKRFEPILSSFNDTCTFDTYQDKELYKETFHSKQPINERIANLTNYIREKTVPAIKNAIFAQVEGAQKRAEDIVKPTVEQIGDNSKAASNKASDASSTVAAKANDAANAATTKTNEAANAVVAQAHEAANNAAV